MIGSRLLAAANVCFMIFVILITLYPFYYMIIVSFSSEAGVLSGSIVLWPRDFNAGMYRFLVEDGRIFLGYRNTLIYMALGISLSLIVTAMGGYAVSKRRFFLAKPMLLLVVFTMFFQGGMIPTFLIVRDLHLINSVWAMVLPTAVATWNLIIMRTFFMNIPAELEESAKIDGMNDLHIFGRIYLPLSKPALATVGLFYAVAIWNNFFSALLYLRDRNLFPLQVILREFVLLSQFSDTEGGTLLTNRIAEEPLKYATIILSTMPILCVYPFLQKYFVKGALIGSLKG